MPRGLLQGAIGLLQRAVGLLQGRFRVDPCENSMDVAMN